MSTKAIDIVTVFYALHTLDIPGWIPPAWENKFLLGQHGFLLELYQETRDWLNKLEGLKARMSASKNELNSFLVENGFDEVFTEDGMGIVSILDMLVEWIKKADVIQLIGHNSQKYTAFLANDYEVFRVEGHRDVVQLKTRSGDLLWLTMIDPFDEMELLHVALDTINSPHEHDYTVSSVIIPNVEFDIKPNLDFLVGSGIGNGQYISEIHQQFKLRLDRTGAEAKVATSMEIRSAAIFTEKREIVFDRPFVGWFTQAAAPHLPIAVFYADYDSWTKKE
jgi:hypothetical protein